MTMKGRIREQGGFDDLPQTWSWTKESTGVTTGGDYLRVNANGEHKYMFDYVTTDYKSLSSQGVIINKPMHKITTKRNTILTPLRREHWPAGVLSDSYFNSGDPHLTKVTGHPLALGPVDHMYVNLDIERLKTIAGTQAQANINPPEFHGLTFVAELKETIGFLHSPIRAYNRWLKRSLRKQRRRNRRHDASAKDAVITLADSLSSNWLAYRYGALPLIYDIQDAANAISALKDVVTRETSRGYVSDSGTNEMTVTGGPLYYAATSKDVTTRREVQVRSGVLYEFDKRDTFGVSMSQIPSTAWEVVPFSFVADWFVNLDDFIGAITPKAGINVLSSWTSVNDTKTTSALGVTTTGTEPVVYKVPQEGTSNESFITEDYNRAQGHAIGIASRPLPFSGSIGTKRIADSLALTFQLLKAKI